MGPPFLAPGRHRELAHRLIRVLNGNRSNQFNGNRSNQFRTSLADTLLPYEQRLLRKALRTFEEDSIRRVIIAAKSPKNISKQRIHIASINKFKSIHGYFSSYP